MSKNDDIRRAFEWIDGVYEEARNLLDACAEHLRPKGFKTTKQCRMREEANYEYLFSQQHIYQKAELSKSFMGLSGISFYEENNRNCPRFILGRILLKRGTEDRGRKVEEMPSQYTLYCGCVNPDGGSNVFRWDDEGSDEIFRKSKPTPVKKKSEWWSDREMMEAVISTWVPLASINDENLPKLLDSAVPFFLKDERNELRETVLKLRGKEQ